MQSARLQWIVLLILFVTCGVVPLSGSGLESNGIGARARGMGFAMIGMADDWTVVHYNPAGAAMIDGSLFGAEYEYFTGGMSSSDSLRNLTLGLGDSRRGDFFDPAGDEPAAFGEKKIGSDIHFGAFGYVDGGDTFAWGIGLYGSGSGTAWEDKGSSLGGDSIKAEIAYTNGSGNVPVVLAWKLQDNLSVGVTLGLHWGLLTVENNKQRSGLFSYTMDFMQETEGIALGIDLGVMWQPREDLSLGAVIKLPYTFRKTGESETELSLLPLIASSDTTVDMKYPLRIALGGAWDVTESDLLAFSMMWLKWSSFRMITDYDDNIPGIFDDDNGNPGSWHDTIRVNAGYERQLNEQWKIRCGLAFDQAPEPEAYRTLVGGQVIDAWLLTVGAGVTLETMTIDFGYIYTYGPAVDGFIPDADYSMDLHELFVGLQMSF